MSHVLKIKPDRLKADPTFLPIAKNPIRFRLFDCGEEAVPAVGQASSLSV
jgi:hypothetical protein